MNDEFFIKQDDRRPSIRATLKDNEGPIDLSSATDVKFRMSRWGSNKVNLVACTIEDAVSGIVRYDWAAGDTDTPGDFQGEFRINWGSSVYQTVPSNDWVTVHVEENAS